MDAMEELLKRPFIAVTDQRIRKIAPTGKDSWAVYRWRGEWAWEDSIDAESVRGMIGNTEVYVQWQDSETSPSSS